MLASICRRRLAIPLRQILAARRRRRRRHEPLPFQPRSRPAAVPRLLLLHRCGGLRQARAMSRHGLLPALMRPLPRRRPHPGYGSGRRRQGPPPRVRLLRGSSHPRVAPRAVAPHLGSRPHHPPQALFLILARLRAPIPLHQGPASCRATWTTTSSPASSISEASTAPMTTSGRQPAACPARFCPTRTRSCGSWRRSAAATSLGSPSPNSSSIWALSWYPSTTSTRPSITLRSSALASRTWASSTASS
ncbi:hypothetical protein HU200_059870 [Digitaria exilis]|uniref:Uncharacterized protein n=1 Tax=Digitaria exilis TaxID=1010633 RepID=A0A835AHJ6_9POAL|nr:hypothetical protein HU200_059870 [Digitaria exilis]